MEARMLRVFAESLCRLAVLGLGRRTPKGSSGIRGNPGRQLRLGKPRAD